MPIVYAGICCHAPGITSRKQMAPAEQVDALYRAYERQRQDLIRLKVDALLVVSSEHFANFFMDNMPSFTIGMAEDYDGPIENPDWLKIPRSTTPGMPDLSEKIIRSVMQSVDVGFSQEWKFDHGMSVPLSFLNPDQALPVIPVNINCQAPPMPPLHRCWALGEALRKAADSTDQRIAIIGTGGTSHWPCTPDSGRINFDWDKTLIERVIHKDKEALVSYQDSQAYLDAGQGAGEMRTSVCLAAATTEQTGEIYFLEPIPVFATTCTIAKLFEKK